MPYQETEVSFPFHRKAYYNGICGGTYPVNDHAFSVERTNHVQKGDNIPDWHGKIRRSENATTYLEGTLHEVQFEPGSYVADFVCPRMWPAYNTCEGIFCDDYEVHRPEFDARTYELLEMANNAAIAKFLKNLKKRTQAFAGLVAAGELNESLRMLRNPAKSLREGIADYLSTLKKGKKRYRDPKDRAKLLADTWLEYSFGWSPLISDIEGAKDALKTLHDKEWISSVRAIRTRSERELLGTYPFGLGLIQILSTYYQVNEGSVIIRGKLKATHAGKPEQITAFEHFGFRLEEFIPTAWELLPWSFLVDYFTNIGDIISSWSGGQGGLAWTNKTRVISKKHELVRATANTQNLVNSGYMPSYVSSAQVQQQPKHTVQKRNVVRDITAGDLSPTFEWQLPGFGIKWANITALAVSYKGLRPFY